MTRIARRIVLSSTSVTVSHQLEMRRALPIAGASFAACCSTEDVVDGRIERKDSAGNDPQSIQRLTTNHDGMPFKSQAQRRKFAQLLVEGKISADTFEEWNRETGARKLPERVRAKTRRPTKRASGRRRAAAKR